MSDNRRFSDDDAKKILNRALELQSASLSPEARAEGTRREELESMAAELGIPPENVEQAIAEIDHGAEPERTSGWLGAPARLQRSASVPVALRDQALEQLAAALPSFTDHSGNANFTGRTLSFTSNEFESMRTGIKTQVLVHGGQKATNVTVTQDARMAAGGLLGGIVGGVGLGAGLGVGLGVGLGALGSVAFATFFPIGMLLASFFGARAIFKAVMSSRARAAETELRQIVEFLRREGEPTDGSAESQVSEE